MSNAVASSKRTAILYSRSTFIIYFFSMVLVYLIFDLYFFEKSISLFNGLIYSNIYNLVFIYFLFLLGFLIIILTSFYPYEITKQKIDYLTSKIFSTLQTKTLFKHLGGLEFKEESNLTLKDNPQPLIQKSTAKDYTLASLNSRAKNFDIEDLLQVRREQFNIIEYPLITQFILIGGITLLSSNDLITIFLSIELQSYGLYILSAMYRNSESSTSAGLTYFLLGGLASCIILLGLGFIYVNSGTTSLDGLYLIHNIITSDNNFLSYLLNSTEHYPSNLQTVEQSKETFSSIVSYSPLFTHLPVLDFYLYTLQFSLIILCIGFLFKISAAPFHSWSPSVYDAIPTVTTTFVAIIPKISILILFFDLVYSTWYTIYDYSWTSILLFSSFLSLIIGSVLGLTQFKIKRLYAYSTISHVGFILLALCVHSVESIQAFFFYIIQYSLSNLNAFLVLVVIGYTSINYNKKTKAYESIQSMSNEYKEKIKDLSPIEYIDQLKGYFYINPMLAISLSITLYSFIGVPPLVGFFAKQMILSSALDNGYIFMCLIAILTSVISAVYYLYIVKHMFFEKSKNMLNISLKNLIDKRFALQVQKLDSKSISEITLSSWLTFVISILSLTILLFIFLYYEFIF